MNIKIESIEKLLILLNGALEDAPITNKELQEKSNNYLDEIESGFTITSEGEISEDVDNLSDLLNIKVANYIFEKYEEIMVTNEDKLIGKIEGREFELYDGDDRKLYLDASTL